MDLTQFLVKAKVATYATDGEGGEETRSDGCKLLEFVEGDFRYRDSYYGFNPFSGQEVVWDGDTAVWSMNYYGKTLSNKIPQGLYDFLKEALRNVGEDAPFRGPPEFSKGLFKYVMKVEGDVNQFIGEESIYYDGELVFILKFHGGRVDSNK
ncbi:MAG: XRE family transcriptional regulator [Candidatus Altiarchaeota archaeon]|nr:XRE family transcriptional regulator [Candidatus Altiarchaeota archaeon]